MYEITRNYIRLYWIGQDSIAICEIMLDYKQLDKSMSMLDYAGLYRMIRDSTEFMIVRYYTGLYEITPDDARLYDTILCYNGYWIMRINSGLQQLIIAYTRVYEMIRVKGFETERERETDRDRYIERERDQTLNRLKSDSCVLPS